jgi:N-acetylneuraminate lyase
VTLNLDAIAADAAHLSENGISHVFVNGTTGESMSLSEEERKAIVATWVVHGKAAASPIRVVAHVGSDSLSATCSLAAHAQSVGADAISAMSPRFFKPTPRELARWIKQVCEAAPELPFYYYHFPTITGGELRRAMPPRRRYGCGRSRGASARPAGRDRTFGGAYLPRHEVHRL